EVRVTGNDGFRIFVREIEARAHQQPQQFARAVALIPQPEASVKRDLFVTAAPRVDFVGEGADTLGQLADHEGVDIFGFGARTFEERWRLRVFEDRIERREDPPAFGSRQNAGSGKRARECLRTAYVGLDQTAVEVKRV